ncbi:MAG: SPOR domain-containing protein [Muribaculaceae bacterium]|nr:SPOR domain-containing protein [Muribaculaceae bacterium]
MRLKNLLIYTVAVASLSFPTVIAAQSVVDDKEGAKNAIEIIQSSSNGTIEIEGPQRILDMLVTPPAPPKKHVERRRDNLKPGINKIRGYRVQVFSDGRDQSTLEARVKMRANAISQRFPKYRGQVYTFSSSPNWYCRVGNFQTQQEAHSALLELKRAFPNFAGEMRVVNSEIIIIKQ